MVSWRWIDNNTRARVYYLSQVKGMSIRRTALHCNVSRGVVWRIIQRQREKESNRCESKASTLQRGRPRKMTGRQGRLLLRCLAKLRDEDGNFTAQRLMESAGMSNHAVSVRTVTRFLNAHGYFYLQARKKCLLKRQDCEKRVAFAKHYKRHYEKKFWTEKVSFYLDGTAFAHKTNPLEQACAPKGRIWRKKSEGFHLGCTSKGCKEGTGGRVLRLMVAISYGKGVIACEPYERMCGAYFANFIDTNFPRMFEEAAKGSERIFIQDGDPSQNSAVAKRAMSRVQCRVINVPVRSPDMHCIENVFHITSKKLKEAKVNRITKESFSEFKKRVIRTIKAIPVGTIDELIASTDKRLDAVITSRGRRIRY